MCICFVLFFFWVVLVCDELFFLVDGLVSAVRLLRIEQGGAFADLLSEKGRGAAENEMAYVERTLGFRTRDLEDRDLRLVRFIAVS